MREYAIVLMVVIGVALVAAQGYSAVLNKIFAIGTAQVERAAER